MLYVTKKPFSAFTCCSNGRQKKHLFLPAVAMADRKKHLFLPAVAMADRKKHLFLPAVAMADRKIHLLCFYLWS